jgi:hypothetical protein
MARAESHKRGDRRLDPRGRDLRQDGLDPVLPPRSSQHLLSPGAGEQAGGEAECNH